MASRLTNWNFVPIIEPVKRNLSALKRALEALIENGCKFILIGNPQVGELVGDYSSLWSEIFGNGLLGDYNNYSVGLNLTASDTLITAENFFRDHQLPTAIIHWRFSDARALAELINREAPDITEHIFVEQNNSTSLYRRHFGGAIRIIVKDGFNVKKNI